MPLSSSEVDQLRGLEQDKDLGTKHAGVQLAVRVDVAAEDPHCGKVERGSVAWVQEEPTGGRFFKVARIVEVNADQVLGCLHRSYLYVLVADDLSDPVAMHLTGNHYTEYRTQ